MLKPTLTYQKIETLIAIRIGLVKTPEEMTQLSGELRDLCEEITFDPDIRVIVLTGAEKNSFSIEPGMASSASEEAKTRRQEFGLFPNLLQNWIYLSLQQSTGMRPVRVWSWLWPATSESRQKRLVSH